MTATSCVATVTDATFLPGTCVLFSSFLRHNPWFDGDLVVICGDLPDQSRGALSDFPNVRWHQVGTPLLDHVAAVTSAQPALAHKARHFYALDAFNLPGYDRVLKLDSDILCLADASPLFAHEAALVACPDQPYFRGHVRHPVTYVPEPAPAGTEAPPAWFNVGMLSLSPAQLGGDVYDRLLHTFDPAMWTEVRTAHTDSVVLNRHFHHAWTRVSERYNYFASKDTIHYTRSRVPMDEAVFLHFVGRRKPWHPRGPAASQPAEYARALAWWDDAAGLANREPSSA